MNGQFPEGSACLVHSPAIASAKKKQQPPQQVETKMLNKIKTAAASALIGLSAFAALPASAQESGIYLNFGGGNEPGAYFGDRRPGDYRYREGYRDDRRWDQGRWGRDRWARGCTPDRALDKAERMGIYRARIADVDGRTITVRGRSRGERVYVTFARAPRCPIIG
jgi:hypothetical protein